MHDQFSSRIRGLIYQIGLRDCQGGNASQRNALAAEIATLESVPESARMVVRSMLDGKKRELAGLNDLRPISFADMVQQLQNEPNFAALFRLYQAKAPMLASTDSGASDFAKMLIYREFGKRPAKATNLETMGLMAVCYPALDQVSDLPKELSCRNLSLRDWKGFLKVCLDVMFRANDATDFPRDWKKWLGMSYNQNFMLPPDRKDHSRFQIIWPQCRRNMQNRLVRHLEWTLCLNADHWEHADIIDNILRQAWSQLISLPGLCSRHEDGVLLKHTAMSFVPVKK